MILKKPYGFLIKHFKIIHLILTVLYIYLAFKVNSILNYYNHFISGTASKLEAISYISQFYVIAILLSIVICIIIYALMRYKKKPRLLYLILIAFYLAVAMVIQVSYQGLETIYMSVLESKTMLLYRDILRIMVIFQYVSVGFVLVRGLGFDIKKFNFVQDLEDLDIDVSDEEEVELTLGSFNSTSRKIHRQIREYKYYYLENKTFILIILGVLIVILVGSLFVHKEFVAKEYKEGQTFGSEDFSFKVLNTYITNRDYNNQEITTTNTSFAVVRMQLSSKNGEKELNTSNLVLKIGNNSYVSNKKYAARFVDLGISYRGNKIKKRETYLFIFNISNGDINKRMKIVYAGNKTVRLSPVMLDEIKKETTYKLKEKIDLTQSSLRSGYFSASSYEVKDSFSYPYEYEVNGQVYTSNLTISSTQSTVLHLVLDAQYPAGLTNYAFLEQYATLQYKVEEKEYSSTVFVDRTPGNYKEGIYVIVDKEVEKASNIWLEIKVRNMKYIYTLK